MFLLTLGASIQLSLLICLLFAADSKPRPVKGIRTPGVQIPFASLKAEAELKLESAAVGLVVAGQKVFAPNGTRLDSVDTKTSKLNEKPVMGLAAVCGGAVQAFESTWIPNCAAKGPGDNCASARPSL